MKLTTTLLSAATLAIGVIVGAVSAGDDDTPGDRLHAFWGSEGVGQLKQRVTRALASGSFREKWVQLIGDELGVVVDLPWKGGNATAFGAGRLHRQDDGVELQTYSENGYERLSRRSFDCYVKDKNSMKRVFADGAKPADCGVVILLTNRIVLINPQGEIWICPRRPLGRVQR
jgi:hypothetical protein